MFMRSDCCVHTRLNESDSWSEFDWADLNDASGKITFNNKQTEDIKNVTSTHKCFVLCMRSNQ